MPYYKRRNTKHHYLFSNNKCIGYSCFAPGEYSHTSLTMSGRKSTGNISFLCMNNAYHGCPDLPSFDIHLAAKRRKEWVLC